MKGLLLKDFYNVKNLILYYALVAAVFAVVSVVSSNIYFFLRLYDLYFRGIGFFDHFLRRAG